MSKLILSPLLLCGLAGCVVPYPIAPPQVPYVAVPGPTKTEAQFRQDDTTCRAFAVQLPQEPARSAEGPPAAAPSQQAAAQQASAGALPPEPPGAVYLHCMAVRGNPIEPLAQTAPLLYGFYRPYPLYVGYGGYYPWLSGGYYGPYVGGFYGFGFNHGYGWGGYGGLRGGGYGGYRGGGRH